MTTLNAYHVDTILCYEKQSNLNRGGVKMSHPFNITTKRKTEEGKEEVVETIRGPIPSEEWDLLLRFKAESESLWNTLQRCGDLNTRVSLKWNIEDGVLDASDSINLDENDLSAILHKMRPFILNKEKTNFYKVANIIKRKIKSEYIHHLVETIKSRFSGKELSDMMQAFFLRGQENMLINSENIFMKWLNAYEYHRDDKKRELLEEIDKVVPKTFSRSLFESSLIDRSKAVIELGTIISSLEERSGREITIKMQKIVDQ